MEELLTILHEINPDADFIKGNESKRFACQNAIVTFDSVV